MYINGHNLRFTNSHGELNDGNGIIMFFDAFKVNGVKIDIPVEFLKISFNNWEYNMNDDLLQEWMNTIIRDSL